LEGRLWVWGATQLQVHPCEKEQALSWLVPESLEKEILHLSQPQASAAAGQVRTMVTGGLSGIFLCRLRAAKTPKYPLRKY